MKSVVKNTVVVFIVVFLILQLISLFYKIDAFSCLLGAGLMCLCFLIDLSLK